MTHREALESMWHDRCSIQVREPVRDPATGVTGFVMREIYVDLPCKLSFKLPFGRVNLTGDGTVAGISQLVTLFLAPEYVVPPGAHITVMHRGLVTEYAQSSKASVFDDHQEIRLALLEKYA